MATIIDKLEKAQIRRVPTFDAGDRVRVHFQVIEGSRRRTQVFEGVVLKRQGSGARETFTVRKQSFGVGVERTFPVHSTKIEKIEVAARGEVRRAKLYYLRDRVGKRARVRERAWTPAEQARLDAEMAGAYDEQGPQAEAELAPPPVDEQAETTADGAAEATSAESSEATPDESPEATPADSSETTTADSSEATPADSSETTTPESAEASSEDAAEAPPAETSAETPADTADATEEGSSTTDTPDAEQPAADTAAEQSPATDETREPSDEAAPSDTAE